MAVNVARDLWLDNFCTTSDAGRFPLHPEASVLQLHGATDAHAAIWLVASIPLQMPVGLSLSCPADTETTPRSSRGFLMVPGPGHEQVPFLERLREPLEEEIRASEVRWSEWLAMEDWMIGPRSPF